MNTYFSSVLIYFTALTGITGVTRTTSPLRESSPGPKPEPSSYARIAGADTIPPRRSFVDSEYVDTIYLGLNKNSYVEVKGVEPLSADVGGDKQNILIAVQENSSIVKLKGLRKGFADANMIVVCKDTILQYLIRYADNPRKNYYAYEIAAIRQKIHEERVQSFSSPARRGNPAPAIATTTVKADPASSATERSGPDTTVNSAYNSLTTPILTPAPTSTKSAAAKDTALPRSPLVSADLSRQAGSLERLRSRKVNLQIGAVAGGLRATLDRLYLDESHRMYYAIMVENRGNSPFKVDYIAFQVFNKFTRHRAPLLVSHVGGKNNPTSIPANSARALVFETNTVAMLPEEVLIITLAEPNKEGAREIGIRLTPTDMTRAADWKED